MRPLLEQWGWGSGLHDLAAGGAWADEPVRRLAWWMLLEACGSRRLALAVAAAFRRPEAPQGPEASMVRLLGLLERLVTVELPRLARAIRVETAARSEAMRAPRGGRVDALATLRARPGVAPEAWVVRRVERRVETPVNLFAAAIVRGAAARVQELGELYRRRRLGPPELVAGAGVALHRFLRDHPLGRLELPPGEDPERHRGAAARRGTEYARIASLVAWWNDLRDTELAALREVLSGERWALSEIGGAAAYELAIALGLLCALGKPLAWAPGGDASEGLRFVGRRGIVVVRFGIADPHGISRPTTATLECNTGRASATWWIDARLCRSTEVGPLWTYLGWRVAQAGPAARGLLITPEVVTVALPAVRCLAVPAGVDAPTLVRVWQTLLDDEGIVAAIL